jgi:cytochrome c-type biogenesis protein CcmH/NrfG
MLNEAQQEALTALALDPQDTSVRNIVALVLAERGEYARAREEWAALLADKPTYEPARTNLAILDHGARTNSKWTASEFAGEYIDRRVTSASRSGGCP